MSEENGDKTEDPSDHKRHEIREKGNVARSVDLNVAASVLAAAGALHFLGGDFVTVLTQMLRRSLGGPAWTQIEVRGLGLEFWFQGQVLVRAALPILGLMLVTSIGVNLAQVGFFTTPDSLFPKFSRINPWEGIKRVFSGQSVVKLGGSVLKLVVLTTIVCMFINSRLPDMLRCTELQLTQFGQQVGVWLVQLSFQLALGLAVLALMDYGFQLWKFEQDLKMTKQEVRDEMRHMEGDPQIRQRRRDAHKKLATSRQMQQVKDADVVITNPTELAIAIKYDAKKMAAPIVVAKGAGELAARIRKLAAEHGVPIVEKKPLARALYRDVKVGQSVPVALYEAVAEILAYVYRLSNKRLK